MRKQFPKSAEFLLEKDPNVVVLLGDIGVFAFQNAFKNHPTRVYNIGILEQSTIGLAAGLSMSGMIPIVHTIAPFIVERSLEQLKDDFGYQKLQGNFISIGASYDYAALGGTHHCPADVPILKNIPDMEIVLPGTPAEFDSLLHQTYADGKPTYTRLSERQNNESYPVKFGKAVVVKKGKKATVVAIGPALKPVLEACKDQDVTVLYYTTVAPFDKTTLKKHCTNGKVLLVEPYYKGALIPEVMSALAPKPVRIENVGVPHEFLTHYGKAEDHDKDIGMTPASIKKTLKKLLR